MLYMGYFIVALIIIAVSWSKLGGIIVIAGGGLLLSSRGFTTPAAGKSTAPPRKLPVYHGIYDWLQRGDIYVVLWIRD